MILNDEDKLSTSSRITRTLFLKDVFAVDFSKAIFNALSSTKEMSFSSIILRMWQKFHCGQIKPKLSAWLPLGKSNKMCFL